MTPPTERHLVTEEEGYNYIGKFYFPCNTSDLKMKKVKSVLLVAGLEVPTEARYVHRCVSRHVWVCG